MAEDEVRKGDNQKVEDDYSEGAQTMLGGPQSTIRCKLTSHSGRIKLSSVNFSA